MQIATVTTVDVPSQEDHESLAERVESLEAAPRDGSGTGYDDTELKARVEALENEPGSALYDDSILVASVAHVVETQAGIVQRVSALETKPDPEPYDDSELSASVSSLDSRVQRLETGPEGGYDDADLRARVEALEARPIGSGGSSAYGWSVNLSTFAGSSDDAKLSAALAYVKAQTYKPVIVLDQMKGYTFSQNQGALFNGLAISGPLRHQDQARSSLPIGNRVNIRTNGFWFNMPASGSVFGVSMSNLSLDGVASSGLISGGGGVLWTSVFHNISAQNFGNLFGSTSSKLLNTACTFSGWWNVNNIQNRAWVVGGSDSKWAFTELLLDSPANLLGPTQYLAEFDSQSKGVLQNVYCTAEGHAAFRFSGGNEHRIIVTGSEIEGRNANSPCPGALIRVEGSNVTIRDTWLAFAMSNPAATGRNDAGYVHVTGGNVLLDGIDCGRASGVAESVPLVYASGGKVRIRNINGQGFTGLPVVRQARAGLIDADGSVQVITG